MMQGSPRAFDKAVWRWPPGFAADAGTYANSIVEKKRSKRGEAASWSVPPRHRAPRKWPGRSTVTTVVVGEAATENLFRSETERCQAPGCGRGVRVADIGFMRLAGAPGESEIGFRQR